MRAIGHGAIVLGDVAPLVFLQPEVGIRDHNPDQIPIIIPKIGIKISDLGTGSEIPDNRIRDRDLGFKFPGSVYGIQITNWNRRLRFKFRIS